MENFFVSWGFVLTCLGSFIFYYLPLCRSLQIPLLVGVSLFIYWLAAGNLLFLLLFCSLSTALFSYGTAYAPHRWRKILLFFGIASSLLLLIFFKYKRLLLPAPLFAGWFGNDPTWMGIYQLALPIGISFYIFHSISLIVDSYQNPEVLATSEKSLLKHILKSMLYLTFFPQLVAGPIAKGKSFYPQIVPKRFIDIDWMGALRALIHGYFLKEVIANNLNQLTAPMGHPEMWPLTSSNELLWMMLGYSAQIFADFAGYSLIAIGLGRLFGYELPINFNSPYFAHSFTNFWQRWHISLSSWLRDYLYIPLGGNRKGIMRTYLNLMVVMALGGLWHGPEWKYAIWGMMHGIALALERIVANRFGSWAMTLAGFRLNVMRVAGVLLVFSYVTLAWLFFRLDSVQEVMKFLTSIAAWQKVSNAYTSGNLLLLYIFTGIVFLYHLLSVRPLAYYATKLKRYDGYMAGTMLLLCLIAKGNESAFIYFQF